MQAPPSPAGWSRPGWHRAANACAITLLLFLLVAGSVQPLHLGFGLWFSELFVFLAPSWLILQHRGDRPARAAGLGRPRLGAILWGSGLGAANFLGLIVPLQFAAHMLAPAWLRDYYDPSHLFAGQNAIDLALILSGVTVAAPFCEEFFFRGVLQRDLRADLSPRAAIAVTAAIFSAFHFFDPLGLVARFELGLLFGWLALRTGSLWPSIAAHAVHNLVSTALYFASGGPGAGSSSTPQAGDALVVAGLAVAGLGGLAGLLAVGRRYFALDVSDAEVGTPASEPAIPAPPPSLLRSALPWAYGAFTALVVLFTFDARGVRLNLIDLEVRLPRSRPKDGSLERDLDALSELRRQARKGEIPIERYTEQRRELVRRFELLDAVKTQEPLGDPSSSQR